MAITSKNPVWLEAVVLWSFLGIFSAKGSFVDNLTDILQKIFSVSTKNLELYQIFVSLQKCEAKKQLEYVKLKQKFHE